MTLRYFVKLRSCVLFKLFITVQLPVGQQSWLGDHIVDWPVYRLWRPRDIRQTTKIPLNRLHHN